MNQEFEQDMYYDTCAVCGTQQLFSRNSHAIRETYHCTSCRGSLREREQARAIVVTYADDHSLVLRDLVTNQAFRELKIYEPGTIGPLRRFLRDLPFYVQSEFAPGVGSSRQFHQDLQDLTFGDESFDLVITSDILEHVRQPIRAFNEIFRVLKPGGAHIFTVPLTTSSSLKTVARVDVTGPEDIPILPLHYHGRSDGPKSLVYTDFGRDIESTLLELNFSVQFLTPETESKFANKIITIISKKSTRRNPIG